MSARNLGNPELDVEKAVHYSLGFEYKPRDNIKLEVTGFYKTLHDLIVDTDDAETRDGVLVPLCVDNQDSLRGATGGRS